VYVARPNNGRLCSIVAEGHERSVKVPAPPPPGSHQMIVLVRTGEFLPIVRVQPSSSAAQELRQVNRPEQWINVQADARLDGFLWVRAFFCEHQRRASATHCDAQDKMGSGCSPGAHLLPQPPTVSAHDSGSLRGRGAKPLQSQAHTRPRERAVVTDTCSRFLAAACSAWYADRNDCLHVLSRSCWPWQYHIGTADQTLVIVPELHDMDACALMAEDLERSRSRIAAKSVRRGTATKTSLLAKGRLY